MVVLVRTPHFDLAHRHINHQTVRTRMDLPSDNQPQEYYFVEQQQFNKYIVQYLTFNGTFGIYQIQNIVVLSSS